jgi:hypothetical protein
VSTALVPVTDLEKMAHAVAASKLFGITTPEQAMALMLVAQAEGLHPATAARDYHIIQGRPTLKADAMLARYLASGGKVEWHEHTDAAVEATFTHPQGGSLKIKWDMARAKQADLKSPMWTKYPRQMLRARVISEGVRATNPAVAVGVYTPEEAEDFEPASARGRGAKAKPAGDAVIVPETGEVVSREEELGALCKQAGLATEFYLNRLKVKSAAELSDADYQGMLANVRSKIKQQQDKAA